MYLYELPTTGAIAFADLVEDRERAYTSKIADATAARANVRAALKESKRAEDGERDYMRIVKVSSFSFSVRVDWIAQNVGI